LRSEQLVFATEPVVTVIAFGWDSGASVAMEISVFVPIMAVELGCN